MLRLLLAAALLLSLPACGFSPLYATNSDNAVATGLRSVEVGTVTATPEISRHVARELRNLLPAPESGTSRYRVNMNLADIRRAVAVRQSESTSRFDYILAGSYQLIDLETGERVHSKRITAQSSYGIVSSQYASLVGREDAARRAAVEIARRIEIDIALYFAGRSPQDNVIELPDILDVDGRFDTGGINIPDPDNDDRDE